MLGRIFRLNIRSKRPSSARRSRRGLGLIEASFTLLLFVLFLPSVLEIIGQRQFENALRREARQVANVASQAALRFSSDFLTVASDTFAATNHMREHSVGSLTTASSVALRAVTSRKRTIRLVSYAPTSDQLLIIAYASFSGNGRIGAPQSEAGNVGWISPANPTQAVSEGLRLDLAPIQAVYTDLDVGDLVAVEYLTVGQNVDPYLHRVSVPGRPDLNRMETGLDLGGNAINNVSSLNAQDMVVSDTLTTGTIAGNLNLTGQLDVSGALITNGPMTVNGGLSVANSLSAGSLTVTNTISASNLTADTVTARTALMNTMNVARDLRGTSVLADTIVAGNATLSAVTGSQVSIRNFGVSGEARVDTVFTNSLSAGGCTGC